MSKINIIPVFVPHYGCPNDCIFCNQVKITNKNYIEDLTKTRLDIEEYLTFFSNKKNETQIAFYGGSFTGLEKSVMIEYLKIANEFIEKKLVDSIRLSTRPDYINDEILKTLKEYNVKTIELGVQSLNEEVLRLNNRGHNSKVVYEASGKIKEYGFQLGLQQMVGLYKDSYERSLYTAKEFVKINPDFVRIYPTLVIKDTELEYIYRLGKYNPLSLEEAIEYIKPIYMMYYVNKINIIRIGLQPTENINIDGDVVAGPFHAAFKQMLLQNLYEEIVSEKISELKNKNHIKIYTNNKELSYIVGNNGINKKRYIEKFNIKKINFNSSNVKNIIIKSENECIEIELNKIFREYLADLGE